MRWCLHTKGKGVGVMQGNSSDGVGWRGEGGAVA